MTSSQPYCYHDFLNGKCEEELLSLCLMQPKSSGLHSIREQEISVEKLLALSKMS